MASLKELKGRIVSVKSTQKITKAKKMVAAAKLRRAQEAAEAAFLEREQGVGLVGMGEREIALGMADFAMTRLGVDAAAATRTVEELRAGR